MGGSGGGSTQAESAEARKAREAREAAARREGSARVAAEAARREEEQRAAEAAAKEAEAKAAREAESRPRMRKDGPLDVGMGVEVEQWEEGLAGSRFSAIVRDLRPKSKRAKDAVTMQGLQTGSSSAPCSRLLASWLQPFAPCGRYSDEPPSRPPLHEQLVQYDSLFDDDGGQEEPDAKRGGSKCRAKAKTAPARLKEWVPIAALVPPPPKPLAGWHRHAKVRGHTRPYLAQCIRYSCIAHC